MGTLPQMYRIALSPFQPHGGGLHSVVADLAPQGFLAQQLCLVGSPAVIAPLASALDPDGAIYPELAHLMGNLAPIQAARTRVPVVASVGPIADVLLKRQSWLATAAAEPVHQHIEDGDVVLAINGLNHEQFVRAARLLLRHGSGNVFTQIFNWPTQAPER
jgi:hypothetical protein